jgi:hypothetical protein
MRSCVCPNTCSSSDGIVSVGETVVEAKAWDDAIRLGESGQGERGAACRPARGVNASL